MSSASAPKRPKTKTTCEDAPPRQKKKFDPQRILENVREKLSIIKKLELACEELGKVAAEVIQSSTSTSALQKLSNTNRYLVLTSYLGHEGLKNFEFAAQLIPNSFGKDRITHVCNIVSRLSSQDQVPLSESTAVKLLPLLSDKDNTPTVNSLMSLSEESGDIHTMFLAPPVKECINPSCDQIGHMNSLSANHAPTDVVVFDIEGPLLASKLSLKCKSCATIYNYNKFGRKTKEGERYYNRERELVEVSDLVFVTRRLYSLYRSLW